MAQEILWKDRKRVWCGLPWTFTVYSLSGDRLFIRKGFFSQKEDEVRLYRILDLSLSRSFVQRIFGLGTITVSSSDKTMKNFEIKNIKNSRDVKELISENVEAQRDAKRIYGREYLNDDDSDDMDEA